MTLSHKQKFDGSDKTRRSHIIEEPELKELLNRLHATGEEAHAHAVSDDDHYATAEAVSEITGESLDHVVDVLEKIREDETKNRISQNLKDAENVLHSVERADTKNRDPLASRKPMMDVSTVHSVLDKIKNDHKLSGYRKYKPKPETAQEKFIRYATMTVASLVVISVIYLLISLILASGK